MRTIGLAVLAAVTATAGQATSFDAEAGIDIEIMSIFSSSGATPPAYFAGSFFGTEGDFIDVLTLAEEADFGGGGFANSVVSNFFVESTAGTPTPGDLTSQFGSADGSIAGDGFAIAEAITDGVIEIENVSSTDTYSFEFSVSALGNASVTLTDPTDMVFAASFVNLELYTEGGDVDPIGGAPNIAEIDPIGAPGQWGYFNGGETSDPGASLSFLDEFSFVVVLEPGESLEIFSIADALGSAESAAIPIGPAAPLLLGALGCFGLLRLRKTA